LQQFSSQPLFRVVNSSVCPLGSEFSELVSGWFRGISTASPRNPRIEAQNGCVLREGRWQAAGVQSNVIEKKRSRVVAAIHTLSFQSNR